MTEGAQTVKVNKTDWSALMFLPVAGQWSVGFLSLEIAKEACTAIFSGKEIGHAANVYFVRWNSNPFELMQNRFDRKTIDHSYWGRMHMELMRLVESIIRQGIHRQEFTDLHLSLTTRLISGLVRSVRIEAASAADRQAPTVHILRIVKTALACKQE